MTTLFYLVPAASVVALLFAWLFFRQMKRESEGTPTMKEIAQYVREGAMAYLKQQYKVPLSPAPNITILFICFYRIFNVMIVRAARIIEVIQNRMVIFDSWNGR